MDNPGLELLPMRINTKSSWGVAAAACLLTFTCGVGLPPRVGAAGEPVRRVRIHRDGRTQLAVARARGDKIVTLLIAARDGETEKVARSVAAVQGSVKYRRDEVGYLRVEVPIAEVEVIAEADGVASVAVDTLVSGNVWMDQRLPALTAAPSDDDYETKPDAGQPEQSQPEPGYATWREYPIDQAYLPLKELGAAELRRDHPARDGRGITIGHVENGIDFLLPEFVDAMALDGSVVPKIADVRLGSDALHTHAVDARSVPWVRMNAAIDSSEGTAVVADKTYTLPRSGRFRLGQFEAGQRFCASLKAAAPESPADDSPSENSAGEIGRSCRFAVLWDEQLNDVWLDTNQNLSFADEKAMTDYRVRRDVGTIGTDDASTASREHYGFVIQTDKPRSSVAVILGNGGHATMVAASAAGSKGKRGRVDGIAPGAQLVEMVYNQLCLGSTIETLIETFADPRVDLVLFEQNAFLAMPYRAGDGAFSATLITSRLIDKYKKPFVVPADNTRGMNTVSEHGNSKWAFSVGAFESKESYRINHGYLVASEDNLHRLGAWGPNGIGEVKPDIVVPSGYLAGSILRSPGGLKGLYRLPPGYSMGGGTSQAAPTMAGALALLMSAAKQEKVPYDAERIWRAVTNSARPIQNLAAYQQGNGAVNLAAAFELLKVYAKTPKAIEIVSSGPVRTAYSSWLATPNRGVGLWEAEGWTAGEKAVRTVTFTRRSGPREPMEFVLSWQHNDGTFACASSITLPLGVEVALPLTVNPQSPGAHGALLTLDHPSVPGHAYRMMATIVAAESLDASNGFSRASKGQLDRTVTSSMFMKIPPAAEAMATTLRGVHLTLLDPLGRRSWASATGPTTSYRPLPGHGIWEIVAYLHNSGLDLAWDTAPGQVAAKGAYSVQATVLGTQIEAPATIAVDSNGARSVDISVSNRFGAFEGGLVSMPLGGLRTERLTLAPYEQRVFEIRVPEGSPLLLAEVISSSQASDGIDLYLFDCTGKVCRPAEAAFGKLQSEAGVTPRLRVHDPKPGLWKVVLDVNKVARDTVVEYADVITEPALGAVGVADTSRKREVGTKWTAKANIWIAEAPEGGRRPCALFAVEANKGRMSTIVGLRTAPIDVPGQTVAVRN